MGLALLELLGHIYGIGSKIWSMALADLLLGADPGRERWVWTGASMVVIDTLLHNHLHRTGTLRRFGAEHPYGARCYAPGGCADIIRGLAQRVDAREFNPAFPACFPRFCAVCGVTAVLGIRTRRLQWKPDRRPRAMPERHLPGVSQLRPGGAVPNVTRLTSDSLTTDEIINGMPLKSTYAMGWAFLIGSPARGPDP